MYIHMYSHGQKNWDTPKKTVIFIYSTIYYVAMKLTLYS